MDNNCLFCKIIKKDIPATVVYEDNKVLGFDDIDPQAPVHCIFVPKQHIPTFNDITSDDISLVGSMLDAARKVAEEKGLSENGYRIVANCNKDAGQEVFHIHLHLLGGRKFSWPPG